MTTVTIINKHRDDSLGGSELQCDLIAEELFKRGYKVVYIAPGGKKDSYGKTYPVVKSEMDSVSIINELKKIRPDIIYWRFNKNYFLPVVKWASRNSTTFIFAASHIRDLKPFEFRKKVGIKGAIKTYVRSLWHHQGFKYIDGLTVNNQDFLDILHLSPQVYIPNGMTDDFTPFSWPRPYCAWISNIKQVKRPEKFVKLAKNFQNSGIDFIMVGAIQESIYQWIKNSSHLPSNLYYLGVKTPVEVSGILRSAKIHVHTCYPEGFPNVLIQSWYQGTPSVSLGFDPNNLIVDKRLGVNAQDDWNVFTAAVKNLLQNDDLRTEYGQNAEHFAKTTFDIGKSVDMLERFFKILKS